MNPTVSSNDQAHLIARSSASRRLDFRPGMDLVWEIEPGPVDELVATAWLGPRQPGPPPHVHDEIEDSWEIIDGRLEILLDDEWKTYGPGERVAAGPGTRHSLRNPFDAPVQLIYRHRPAGDMEAFFTDMATLASSGRIGWGPPHGPREAIYGSLLLHAHPTAMRQSRPARLAFAALARLGRLFGARI